MTSSPVDILFDRWGPGYRWLVTITVMLGTMSTVLTATMINVAIPVIMGTFGIGQDKAHWLSTGFLAAMTVFMLLSNWAVRSFGMRLTFLAAMAIFLSGAVIGGVSPDEDVLIFARLLQGAGAGLIQPISMVIMFRVFPESQRGQAMGIFGLGIVLAPGFGPTLGGFLVDAFDWRYVFFAAVPVTILASVLASLFLPWREESGPRERFDWTGFFLIFACVGCLLTGLSNGQRDGWYSLEIALLLLIGGGSGVGFVIWELLNRRPILQMRLFVNPQFAAASIIAVIRGAGFFGTTYLIPLFVQLVQGYTPTRSGLLMVPAGLVMIFMFPLAGRISDWLPKHYLLMFGLFVFGFSTLLMAGADTNTAFWVFAGWLMLGRFGMSFIMPTLNVSVLKSVPEEMLNEGSAAFNFMRQLGGALGVNLVAIVLERRTSMFSDALAATQTIANDSTRELLREIAHLLGRSGLPQHMQEIGALRFLSESVFLQANMLAFRDAFAVIGIMFLLSVIPAWYLGFESRHRRSAARQAAAAQ